MGLSAMRIRIVQSLRVVLTICLLSLTAFEGRAQTGNLKKVDFTEASLEDVISFFRDGPGAAKNGKNILIDPALSKQEIRVTFTLHDVPRGVAFAYAAEIGGFDYREERHALRLFPLRGDKPVRRSILSRGGPMTSRRAAEIFIPTVEFEETELAEVVNDISNATRKLDPKKKGLNIILGRGVDPTTPVTFSLQNVPAATVLKYVAEFARVNLRVDGSAIVLTSRQKVGDGQ